MAYSWLPAACWSRETKSTKYLLTTTTVNRAQQQSECQVIGNKCWRNPATNDESESPSPLSSTGALPVVLYSYGKTYILLPT